MSTDSCRRQFVQTRDRNNSGQSEVTSVIVEETLIAKSSMVWIRLVEDISVTTGCTFNDCVLQVGPFAHSGFYRLTRMESATAFDTEADLK